jgi:hypothetical protein
LGWSGYLPGTSLELIQVLTFFFQAPGGEGAMQDEQQQELWLRLCQQAANEQDTEKFMALIHEINVLLNKKEQRLKQERQHQEW